MEAAQSTFISSSFWTERIGPAAALKTLEVMERTSSWDQITRTGLAIRERWLALARRHGLPITLAGLPALSTFSFDSPNALAYKTLLTQEMLARGYLAGTAVYVCTEHTQEVVDAYFEALDPVFGLIRRCEDGLDVASLLHGPIVQTGGTSTLSNSANNIIQFNYGAKEIIVNTIGTLNIFQNTGGSQYAFSEPMVLPRPAAAR